MMIDLAKLEKALVLHNKTFALFRWVGMQMRNKSLDLSCVHKNMSAADAAFDWLGRNDANLPRDVRPDENERRAFACLFVSYLQTSFEIGNQSRLESPCGCYCDFCSYLTNAPYLKIRSISKKARETAMALKRLYLQELERDLGIMADSSLLNELVSLKSPLARQVAMATYAKELMQRTEYATQGEGVYALWREFAWMDGHPNRDFKLTVEDIEQAQKNIIAVLQ